MSVRVQPVEPPAHVSDRARELFTEAAGMGFTPLGWVEVTMDASMTLAGLADADGAVVLALIALSGDGPFDPIVIDLVTQFEGDVKLTTTTSPMAFAQPERGIHKFSYPGAAFAELLARHREHAADIGVEVAVRVRDLPGLAASILSYLEYEQAG